MDNTLDRIRDKLVELRLRDQSLAIFGASHHRHLLNPCLTEEQIREVERTYQIALPEDYRAFLREIGNGGAGPEYGVYSLQQSIAESAEDKRLLALPFPYTAAWNLDWRQFRDELGDEAGLIAYEEEYFRDEHAQGALRIHTAGCNHDTLLVLNGPERGAIWLDDRTVDNGIFPFEGRANSTERLIFLEWYEAWLDTAIASFQA